MYRDEESEKIAQKKLNLDKLIFILEKNFYKKNKLQINKYISENFGSYRVGDLKNGFFEFELNFQDGQVFDEFKVSIIVTYLKNQFKAKDIRATVKQSAYSWTASIGTSAQINMGGHGQIF